MEPIGKSELHALLEAQIRRDGPLRFDSFMRQCLYTPLLGYYERPGLQPGRHGDFYTSVSVGPVFGELLGDFARHVWAALGEPARWHLCEQGAHHGQLAADVLARLRSRWPRAYESVSLLLIEPSPGRQSRQEQALKGHAGKAAWLADERDLPAAGWQGLFYSNELPDSFPVRRLEFKAGRWQEYWVDCPDGVFAWTTRPAEAEAVDFCRSQGIPEQEGYRAEWSPEAAPWMGTIARSLRAGAVLTIDYGWPAHELYRPEKSQGSLTAFAAHRAASDPLSNPGGQDLTAQVNFTELEKAGMQAGLETVDFTDQHRFLTRLAAQAWLPEIEAAGPDAQRRLQQFKTLIRPELMGAAFKVLLQGRHPEGNVGRFRI
jgi:SAM-dependent MidA family methyltransferase